MFNPQLRFRSALSAVRDWTSTVWLKKKPDFRRGTDPILRSSASAGFFGGWASGSCFEQQKGPGNISIPAGLSSRSVPPAGSGHRGGQERDGSHDLEVVFDFLPDELKDAGDRDSGDSDTMSPEAVRAWLRDVLGKESSNAFHQPGEIRRLYRVAGILSRHRLPAEQ